MTSATYTTSTTRKPASKPVRPRTTRIPAAALVDDQPLLGPAPAYSRIHEQKSSRLPLIAGGIAVVATIALVAGTSRTARDAEPFTPAQTATSPAALVAASPSQPLAATPNTQLIAPVPAPAVREQARVAPRTSPLAAAPMPFDASTAGRDASASAPAVTTAPAPITIPPVQSAPETEAAPVPQPAIPQTSAFDAPEPEVTAPMTPAPMSNWGSSNAASTILSAV